MGRDHGGRRMKRLVTWSGEGMRVGGAGVRTPHKAVRGLLWSQADLGMSPQVCLLRKLVVNSHPPLRGL